MRLLLVVFAFALTLADQLQASDWQIIHNCQLIENEGNNSDSIHVNVDGYERIFRLYFVDAPEADSGGQVESRGSGQAAEFGISELDSVELVRLKEVIYT